MSDEPLPPAPEPTRHRFTATAEEAGERLDRVLAARLPRYSRTYLAGEVREGRVTLNGASSAENRRVRPGTRLEEGDRIDAALLPRITPNASPEPIDLTILHEDRWLLAVDKAPGLTVHPGTGEPRGTLANALAFHFERLSSVQGPLRPGIVHRLDKETSGVILVAKDDATHQALADQFRARTVRKEYLAVVRGVVEFDEDVIATPIGASLRHPTRMAIRHDVGRPSETRYQVIERFRAHSSLRCLPRTGRTHQIRVHLASIRHPIVSDRVYGGMERELVPICHRQALHARRITFDHPGTGERVTLEAPLPADLEALLEHLRESG